MNFLSKDLNIYFQTNWKSVLSSLLSMNITFKAIVYICNRKSFNNLVVTLQEENFMDDIFIEYGFYQASKQEIPLSRSLGSWDEFAIFGIPISFIGRKVYTRGDFDVKVFSSVGPHLQLSIFGRTKVI